MPRPLPPKRTPKEDTIISQAFTITASLGNMPYQNIPAGMVLVGESNFGKMYIFENAHGINKTMTVNNSYGVFPLEGSLTLLDGPTATPPPEKGMVFKMSKIRFPSEIEYRRWLRRKGV